MILDTIVARKKEEVRGLLDNGYPHPEEDIDPPRGFKKTLIDFDGVDPIRWLRKP